MWVNLVYHSPLWPGDTFPQALCAKIPSIRRHAERLDASKAIWSGGQEVIAMAYNTMIPGYDTKNPNNLRLWESKPQRGFDLQSFNGEFA